jgi:prepilin-type N-terminal cleavage/methylation domain-containing protein
MKKGFSLMEMIVALSVFSIAALLSVSALLSMTSAQKKARALQIAQDNLRFSVEIMAKDIRTGRRLFYCGDSADDLPTDPTFPSSWSPKNCPTGGHSITFRDSIGRTVTYRYNQANQSIEKLFDGDTTNPQPFTSSNIVVDMDFYVSGAFSNDGQQPLVTVVIRGVAGSGRELSTFNLQTSITQRKIEFAG